MTKGQSCSVDLQRLSELTVLPRPVYGALDSIANTAIGDWHQHLWGQLGYSCQGHVRIETCMGLFLAAPDTAVWIPAGIEHRVFATHNAQLRSLYIDQSLKIRAEASPVSVQIDPLLRELIAHFSLLPVDYDETGADGRLVQVLIDRLHQAEASPLCLPWPGDSLLLPICRQLSKQPDCPYALTDFAQMAGVSSKTLSRHFQSELGMTFAQWRRRCRLLHALELLDQGLAVTAVALEVGYASGAAFSAAFYDLLGRRPSQMNSE